MPANGFFSVVGLQTNLPSQGSNSLGPFTIGFSDTEYDAVLSLSSGANTIAVPAGAIGVWIVPAAAGTTALTLKGVTGDTGVPISPNTPSFLAFDTVTPNVPASLVLTAGGTCSVGIRFC